ncbi:lysM and putative peptidoglycan-binding domain-containing protein 3 [Hemicordylus capensis]|uniref:lysM and putative peptidoglycan-binding domain-containing protein 3 n=1 Tax=Hemicordylus capensis TaxID=884348 RepID=UPI0023020420|nr:lysM and putative peptidoglycan-binding domain-containing protein 3 [Hemicordylus capensis]XP_053160027.1 lysM and putative peptidoglycan-binding domain-containing protein 3 [Hemicordylus capensis]XP_053160028.1 lysM and putative peptidoglycan-binding domain-containing protein 3 [Hemicordylus capensis]XP_053160029.1 lysM and putative peptidoglycan-binding domain-containing protein 3 [Hemicordylus capensis]
MTAKNQNLNFQPPPLVQPTVVSHVYSFGNGISSDSDALEEETEVYELRPRGREKIRRSTSRERMDDTVFITKDIQEGDTLNAISLQYCCSVADIKRVNNLITDQDFFALRSIKIPVKKFSLLTESQCFPKSRQISRSASTVYSEEYPDPSLPPESFSTETVGNFLKEVDRDIEQIVKCNATKRENLNEVVSALSTQQLSFEPDGKSIKRKDPYYGADWGIGWWTAVVIMVVVGIVTPVFYLLYYEILVKVDVSHHSTVEYSQTTTTSQPKQLENGIHPPVS